MLMRGGESSGRDRTEHSVLVIQSEIWLQTLGAEILKSKFPKALIALPAWSWGGGPSLPQAALGPTQKQLWVGLSDNVREMSLPHPRQMRNGCHLLPGMAIMSYIDA